MADKDAVRKQMEFYFSDANFRKDTFLRAAAEADADGYVPISTLLTFNKLKQLTIIPGEIVEAINGSQVCLASSDG